MRCFNFVDVAVVVSPVFYPITTSTKTWRNGNCPVRDTVGGDAEATVGAAICELRPPARQPG